MAKDEKLIELVLLLGDEERGEQLQQAAQGLVMPHGFRCHVTRAHIDGQLAPGCNQALAHSQAKYKVFLTDNVARIDNRTLFLDLMQIFALEPQAGIVGLFGSTMPPGGDLLSAHRRVFGRYDRLLDAKKNLVESVLARNPLRLQEVSCLEPDVLATSLDLPWDEAVGNGFLAAAQAARLRERGLKAVVAEQKQPWVLYHQGGCAYQREQDAAYERERQVFASRYPDAAWPLVSIIITTYNQPRFFREALESALAQDWPRCEIIVGDDSTDTRTRELVQPYLASHPEIRYFYHGGPLGGHGSRNMKFCLRQARGAYVNFLFDDDLFYPRKISRMMGEYMLDAAGEISFVTSARDRIDAGGKLAEHQFGYRPERDVEFQGRELGRKMLLYMMNMVGEPTTVLLRRQDALGQARYFGVEDRAMKDISTWLDLCRRGGKCVFLHEPLSAFRRHDGQKTFNADVAVTSRLDWLDFLVLSHLHGVFLRDGEEFWQTALYYQKLWSFNPLPEEGGDEEDGYRERLALYERAVELIEGGRRGELLDAIIGYMLDFTGRPELLAGLCERDPESGLWRKTAHGWETGA